MFAMATACGSPAATSGSIPSAMGTGAAAAGAAQSSAAGVLAAAGPAAGAGVTGALVGGSGASGAGSELKAAGGVPSVGQGAGGMLATPPTGAAGRAAGVAGASGADSVASGVAGIAAPVSMGPNTNAGFMNLAPAMGAALDGKGSISTPAAPPGWTWYQIEGAVCRDGSPTGFYVREGKVDKLLIYLEGGGACSSPGFCSYNPANVNEVLNGDGQTVAGSIGGAVAGHQQPGPDGIFNMTQASNPFKDWSQIYVPYCTGDVHFGTRKNVMLPGLSGGQQFVGYLNMKLFISRIVPTFKDKVSRVVLTGSSAGGFGALLNYSMVQDAFGTVLVSVLNDSAPSFPDNPTSMPVCLQKNWREIWGLNAAFPPECTECQQADGGGLDKLATFLFRKHPNATIGVVSSMQDEVIRLFYSSGLQNCANFTTADPTTITLGQVDPTVYLTGEEYTKGLKALRMQSMASGKVATYFLGGASITYHQHIWRQRFYDAAAGTESIATWTSNFLGGKLEHVGP